jgi:hypothetical protein
MVRIIPSQAPAADTLKAFLVTGLTKNQLDTFKRAFEKGAKVHLNPMLHLEIIRAPGEYLNESHAHIRTQETEAGNTDPFVVIDNNVVEKNAVWYVGDFADENDVECGVAESEHVLMKALVRTEALAISHVCWQEGNPPMGEELEALGSGVVPLRTDSVQTEPLGADDDEGDEQWSADEIEVIAEAGEYETTTDDEICSNMSPMPREAVRLLPSIAQRENLISEWTWDLEGSRSGTPNSDGESLPAGSVRISAKFDLDVPRTHYEWPEGSL